MIELFKKHSDWFGESNSTDVQLGWNLSDYVKSILRQNFRIKREEEIFFMRDTSFWNNQNQGLVITDAGIYTIGDNDNPDSTYFFLGWGEFDSVQYQELVFYFYDRENVVAQIPYGSFFKDEVIFHRRHGLCGLLTEAAALVAPTEDPNHLLESGCYEDAISWADATMKSSPEDPYGYVIKARALYYKEISKEDLEELNLEDLNLANRLLDKALKKISDEDTEGCSTLHIDLGNIKYALGRYYQLKDNIVLSLDAYYQARNEFILGLEGSEEENHQLYECIDDIERDELSEVWREYSSKYDYKDRKFIMPISDTKIAGCVVDGIDVFRVSNIPSSFKFTSGHPIPSQLYMGHPYITSLYVPFEESEEMFFIDKVHELCFLLECLGAEEIKITSIKGKSVDGLSNQSSKISGSADVKLFSADGERNGSVSVEQSKDSRSERGLSIRLDPMKYPYVPDNLVWYSGQVEWQRLAQRRLDNNILEYSEYLSSSQSSFTSFSEIQDIKAKASYLWIKANANVEQNTFRQFKETIDTQWRVEVKFRSLRTFSSYSFDQNTDFCSISDGLSEKDIKYISEYNFCIEDDGVITDVERRFLDRQRDKLGLSVSRAQELEGLYTQPKFSDEEKEYMDAFREEVELGEISEGSRRLLNRLRLSLDISEVRAQEIESFVLK